MDQEVLKQERTMRYEITNTNLKGEMVISYNKFNKEYIIAKITKEVLANTIYSDKKIKSFKLVAEGVLSPLCLITLK